MCAFVVPHDPRWKTAFEDQAKAIERALGTTPIQLHHIGSTAIPGILAKPIIDLLGTVHHLDDMDAKAHALESLGYEVMGAYGIDGRRYFRKLDRDGTPTHHLHVFEQGSQHAERHLAFRDYLIAHPEVAKDYSALKERLTKDSAVTWDSYMDGKEPFVNLVEPKAVDWFRKRTR
nr:GrpB family protein [uncultured Roseobacter sp.]